MNRRSGMNVFTIDGYTYDETALDKNKINQLINKHFSLAEKIRKNQRYYLGFHEILNREKKSKKASNNKVVCNHAKDISDTATGYFMNAPIAYSSYDDEDKKSIDRLTDIFDKAEVDDVDSDNAHDMSVCGVAYEYMFVKKDTTDIAIRNIEADHTFLVYDDTIEQNLLFGVYYYRFKDDITEAYCYRATVATKNYIYNMVLECAGQNHKDIDGPVEHHFGNVPIIEYRNNKLCIGDFEQQISLIDAYNTITSDRINDKEQFVEALLVVYGALLGDDTDETSEAMKKLQGKRAIRVTTGCKSRIYFQDI